MLWKLFQGTIFVAVAGYCVQLTKEDGHEISGFAASLVGMFFAYVATLAVNAVLGLAKRIGQPEAHESFAVRTDRIEGPISELLDCRANPERDRS